MYAEACTALIRKKLKARKRERGKRNNGPRGYDREKETYRKSKKSIEAISHKAQVMKLGNRQTIGG